MLFNTIRRQMTTMGKSKLLNDLTYSSKNFKTVREKTQQFDERLKLFVETYKEYVKLLPEDIHESEEN